MPKERVMTNKEWREASFPYFPIPPEVVTQVNTVKWENEIQNIQSTAAGHAAVPLLKAVLLQLQAGADSGVVFPGTTVTKTGNFFTEPEDCIKMADALASEVKAGNLAGPLDPSLFPNVKINSFMAIPKPSGDRRQVGNLSSPAGLSFNDGISEEVLACWSVTQTTAKQFSLKLTMAGWGAAMSKSDMVSAYKTIQVCVKQRWLQGFMFCGKLFIDLCLIFGDRAACMIYDRFHFCILHYLVLPQTSLPARAVGKTVDDITAAVPAISKPALIKFVRTYREQLSALNIKAAPSDNECVKAFDMSTKGEVLGVIFSTNTMTWHLSLKKTKKLTDLLWRVASSRDPITLQEAEKLAGKLASFAQLAPPLVLLTSSLTSLTAQLISMHLEKETVDRSVTSLPSPQVVREDCRIMAAIIADTIVNPLPIVTVPSDDLLAMPIYTDASGCLYDSPSLGILISRYRMSPPYVASVRFPYHFMEGKDKHGRSINCKTTMLESLAYLTTLLLDPERFINQSVIFKIDSIAAVAALRKGRSTSDELATTIIRAARAVAASLGCRIASEWVPRRSDRGSIVADELTHNLTACLSPEELQAYLTIAVVSFPSPILSWMAVPTEDHTLSRKCLLWMDGEYPQLKNYLRV